MPHSNCLALLCCTLILALTSPVRAKADSLIPFATSNQNPLTAIYGLPATAPAQIVPQDRSEVSLRMDLASNCSLSSNKSETILLDSETTRLALTIKHSLGHELEIGMEIPYVFHNGGFLDDFIRNFHETFGMPTGDREAVDDDQVNYYYAKESDTQLDIDSSQDGLGDLRFMGAWQVWRQEQKKAMDLAVRLSLKLPTGDADKLTGSGSTDLALWLSAAKSNQAHSLALSGSAGILLLSDGDVLEEQQNNSVLFGSVGVGWQAFEHVALKVQLDCHTSFYDESDLRELGESVQLVFGGTVDITEDTALDLAMSEDIMVDTSPDVVFHLALRTRF